MEYIRITNENIDKGIQSNKNFLKLASIAD